MRRHIATALRILAALIWPESVQRGLVGPVIYSADISIETRRIHDAILAGAIVEADTQPYTPVSDDELARMD